MSGTKSSREHLKKLVLDTSILVEYIVSRSPYRKFLEQLLSKAEASELSLYVCPVTLSETMYVADRIYKAAGVPNPNEEAYRLASWVHHTFNVIELDYDLLVMAAEFKKTLRIALPDCFVIASAKKIGGAALFKKIEEEMRPVLDELRKHNILFAQELLEQRKAPSK